MSTELVLAFRRPVSSLAWLAVLLKPHRPLPSTMVSGSSASAILLSLLMLTPARIKNWHQHMLQNSLNSNPFSQKIRSIKGNKILSALEFFSLMIAFSKQSAGQVTDPFEIRAYGVDGIPFLPLHQMPL